MEENHRINSLPEEFLKWLDSQDQKYLFIQLKEKITEGLSKLKIDINNIDKLEKCIELNDVKYHEYQNNNKESMAFFRKARLISAGKFIQENKTDDAIYEYFHSFDTEDIHEIIKHITN